MQVGENSILLGYCALPLGVQCLLFWEHVMASSSTVIRPVSSTDHWPLKMRSLQSLKAWEITPTEKKNIPQERSSEVHHFKSLKTQVSFKCVLYSILEYSICKKEVKTVTTTTFTYQFHCLLQVLACVKSHHQTITKYTCKDYLNTTY